MRSGKSYSARRLLIKSFTSIDMRTPIDLIIKSALVRLYFCIPALIVVVWEVLNEYINDYHFSRFRSIEHI